MAIVIVPKILGFEIEKQVKNILSQSCNEVLEVKQTKRSLFKVFLKEWIDFPDGVEIKYETWNWLDWKTAKDEFGAPLGVYDTVTSGGIVFVQA